MVDKDLQRIYFSDTLHFAVAEWIKVSLYTRTGKFSFFQNILFELDDGAITTLLHIRVQEGEYFII